MKKSYKVFLQCLFFIVLSLSLTACSKERQLQENEKEYELYYINKSENNISAVPYITESKSGEELVTELLNQLSLAPEDPNLRSTITESMEYKDFHLYGERLSIDFLEGYTKLSPIVEVLTRAAIVRTLCQIEEIDYVTFTVNDIALMNASGTPIGAMTADLFVENAGDEINSYEKAKLVLYFTDKDGKKLIPYEREVVYNSNISLDKLVIEQLIGGPTAEEAYPTVPPNAKTINVSVRDGICYVNFDVGINEQINNVLADTTIYSIVNSLCELNTVNKVQISINGDSEIVYKELVPLNTTLERKFEFLDRE